MITKKELLQGRDKTFADKYTHEISANLDLLLEAVNVVRAKYGKPMYVSSGWRPRAVNASLANAAPRSNHMVGLAVDFKDPDGALWEWCLDNLALLKQLGLYLEDKRWTRGWTHFQLIRPASGKRIFVPSKGLAPHPALWDGQYDKRFDK